MTKQERIRQLQELIKQHDIAYEQNKPIITDSEYDALYAELCDLEAANPEYITEDSPTQKIYTFVAKNLVKEKHTAPILSQQKTKNVDGIVKWLKQVDDKKILLVIQHKLDGLTLVLTYKKGILKKAVTRGNGSVGENVTHIARVIPSIPQKLNQEIDIEIRGEVIVFKDDFNKYNTNGEYSNARNFASGSLRQLDANVAKDRKLQFIAFDIVNKTENDNEMIDKIKELQFQTVYSIVQTLHHENDDSLKETINRIIEEQEALRSSLPYDIDGLVFKFCSIDIQKTLGETSKFPRWAIAYKFESQNATTKLLAVEWTVGKTGQITPVANFEMIDIDNVEITKATLHNHQNIVDKDIRIGDTIVVERANDVIPQVVQSIKEVRTGKESKVSVPSNCHCCGTPIVSVTIDKTAMYSCPNFKGCKEQVKGRIVSFASRDALNIDGLGEQVVSDLFEAGILNNVNDIYTAIVPNKEAILNIERYGNKKFDNLVNAIEESKKAVFSQVLYGLCIPGIGRTVSKDIAKKYETMKNMLAIATINGEAFKNELQTIEGIGEKLANNLCEYLQDEDNLQLINNLLENGLTMEEPIVKNNKSSLIGLTFVITGTLSKPRPEIQKEIEQLGGKVSGSVSKKTSYLLLGTGEENSSKYKKAVELGVKIINEKEFNELLVK